MAHIVAFYPDPEGSLAAARALVDGGARYLEVQFPFSDPTADGPLIQEACRRALEQGFKVEARVRARRAGSAKVCDTPIYIMGYANTVFFHGVEWFLDAAARSGAQGVIVPDLPHGLRRGAVRSLEARRNPGGPGHRSLHERPDGSKAVLSCGAGFVYAATQDRDHGRIHRDRGPKHRLSGAGRETRQRRSSRASAFRKERQVEALSPYVHACVVGSALK